MDESDVSYSDADFEDDVSSHASSAPPSPASGAQLASPSSPRQLRQVLGHASVQQQMKASGGTLISPRTSSSRRSSTSHGGSSSSSDTRDDDEEGLKETPPKESLLVSSNSSPKTSPRLPRKVVSHASLSFLLHDQLSHLPLSIGIHHICFIFLSPLPSPSLHSPTWINLSTFP